jgi:hypothetical protein
MGRLVVEWGENGLPEAWQSSVIIENVFLVQCNSGKPRCFNDYKSRVLAWLRVVPPE